MAGSTLRCVYDAVIVLGGGLSLDGALPAWVERRLEKGAQLFAEARTKYLIMSGGLCRAGVTEAEAMRRSLLARSIPDAVILKEEESFDMLSNAHCVRDIYLEPRGWRCPAVVTTEFHLPRTRLIFRWALPAGYQPEFVAASDEGICGLDFDRVKEREELLNLGLTEKGGALE